jgi:hypothetical protein
MSLYRVTTDKLESVSRTTFAAESLLERKDLQRLLRCDITPVGDGLMVIAEEYGQWEDSSRRIDLLCLSKEDRRLVVVEIKRTEDGGHMELQAIRYAAMVSSMTLEQVIKAYTCTCGGEEETARKEILNFLQLASTDEAELTGEVRIVLVSADFSTEITTSVLWLNKQGLDITCLRLRPHKLRGEVLIDATQIIPLPEAADYEVKLRAQEKEKRRVIGHREEEQQRFWAQLIDRSGARTPLLANRSAPKGNWISVGVGRSDFKLALYLLQEIGFISCTITLPSGESERSKAFKALLKGRKKLETAFGGELDWNEYPDRPACSISAQLAGGWKSPESEWPEIQDRMVDALIRLESALKPLITEFRP